MMSPDVKKRLLKVGAPELRRQQVRSRSTAIGVGLLRQTVERHAVLPLRMDTSCKYSTAPPFRHPVYPPAGMSRHTELSDRVLYAQAHGRVP